jgi:hypothetical protein
MIPTADASGDVIRFLLNELIRFTSIPNKNIADSNNVGRPKTFWARDSVGYFFSNDTASFTSDQINISAAKRWNNSPIMSSNLSKNGAYDEFADFQSDKIIPAENISVVFNESDSLYRMDPADSAKFAKQRMPWGICVDKQLDIHLWGNSFQKLEKTENTFQFYVPYSMPDMYSILSLYEIDRTRYSSTVPTGNLFADLGGIAVTSLAGSAVQQSQAKKSKEEDKKHNYRTCLINMDSGDFIYY